MRGCRGQIGHSSVSRLIVVLALGGLAAGCSAGNVRLGDTPLFAANNSAQPTALAPIESSALAPPAIPATSQTTTSASLKAKGYTVEGASVVEVGTADTAQTLSQGFGVPVDIILEANGLIVPADIRPGQKLIIPKRAEAVPAVAAPAVQTAALQPQQTQTFGAPPTTLNAQAAERRHQVQPGETLWSISVGYGVDQEAVKTLNGLTPAGTVVVGQTLRIPAPAVQAPTAPVSTVAAAPVAPAPVAPVAATAPAAPKVAVAPQAPVVQANAPATQTAAASTTAAPASAASGSNFRWPVRGRIIAGFGKQADGARNDGINLAVPAGTPVRAAEAGTVIYSGNELEGYGNLILVQHGDDWVSAYAHNETLSVSRGDKVERGQTIASVGKSGSVEQPQLHFELRKKSKPVDPLPHLSGA